MPTYSLAELTNLASQVQSGGLRFNTVRKNTAQQAGTTFEYSVAADQVNADNNAISGGLTTIIDRIEQIYKAQGFTLQQQAATNQVSPNTPPIQDGRNASEALLAAFPWVAQMVDTGQLHSWLADGFQGEAIIGLVRQQPKWTSRFAGIRREDGTLRMNEATFLQREDDYERVLRQQGIDTSAYSGDSRFQSFFDLETDPNELQERLERYDTLKRSGRDTIDAFYVYAGLRISVDDLYRSVVDPKAGEELSFRYEQAVAKSPVDYQTFITRATEAGLERVTSALNDLRDQGVDIGDAATRIRSLAPAFGAQMADLLNTGGRSGTKSLALNELLHAFEYAMIGSAASANGLVLPEAERLEQFRQAGVDRAKALEAYGQYAANRNLLSGMVQRAGRGDRFDQTDFEDAVFLRTATATQLLERATKHEESLAKNSGSAALRQDTAGRFQQTGLRSALS